VSPASSEISRDEGGIMDESLTAEDRAKLKDSAIKMLRDMKAG
jgi:hypothetical protein